jgi:hypothetical protein
MFWYVQAYESQQAELLLRQSYSISMNTKILTFAESCDQFITSNIKSYKLMVLSHIHPVNRFAVVLEIRDKNSLKF